MFALLALVTVLHLTAKDNAKHFTVQPHEKIVMTLPWNPSTRCDWEYTPSPLGDKVVKLVSRRGGPPGKQIWRFRARERKGSMVLGFSSICASGAAVPDVVSVRIRVR